MTLEEKVNDMHGDVKVIISELKRMNGNILDNKTNIITHTKESEPYRKKIDIIWASIHTAKWAILLLFGTGVIWKVYDLFTR